MSTNAWAFEGERPPAQAWIDFGNFVIATDGFPEDASDDDWSKLIRWADILLNRYNNKILNMTMRRYLDSASDRSKDEEKRDWRAHRGNETANNSQVRVG